MAIKGGKHNFGVHVFYIDLNNLINETHELISSTQLPFAEVFDVHN